MRLSCAHQACTGSRRLISSLSLRIASGSRNAPNTRWPGEKDTYNGSIMPLAPAGQNKLRKPTSHSSYQAVGSMHWLFRTNIPRRRSSYYPCDIRKRNFFGLSEIVGVLTNPAETVRSLTESKKLLDEARQEIYENRERSQIRPKHTFSRLPGFFPRDNELSAIEKTLEGDPGFLVICGASSVGKTALLREVLCKDSYHVLHFDLRIAGFADLPSLYMSLSRQMEQYFEAIAKTEGFNEFEKEAWSFKHDRLNVERRITTDVAPESGVNRIKTSDIARLMELFQSSLLKYWEFDPHKKLEEEKEESQRRQEESSSSNQTRVNGDGRRARTSTKIRNLLHLRSKDDQSHESNEKVEKPDPEDVPPKKMPVIFFDEAHKLPALLQSTDAVNCLLDSFLVLSKQDRLCHVVHATSDPYYLTWLRQLNVMQHCKIITVGDCSKGETRAFFRKRLLPRVPESLQHALDFEVLYDAFGGKLVHWHDFVTDYVNSNGRLGVNQSSHFVQAHALLNLHMIHSPDGPASPEGENQENANLANSSARPSGFKIYSAISNPRGPSRPHTDGGNGAYESEFTSIQLFRVMSRMTEPGTTSLPYFDLAREYGANAVDGMVKGRILDLRWTDPVTTETEDSSYLDRRSRPLSVEGPVSSGRTFVNPDIPAASEEDMVAVSERELDLHNRRRNSRWRNTFESSHGVMDPVPGPKLVPATPIMKYAMREVLCEYEEEVVEDVGDNGSVTSEYASLSDVDEY